MGKPKQHTTPTKPPQGDLNALLDKDTGIGKYLGEGEADFMRMESIVMNYDGELPPGVYAALSVKAEGLAEKLGERGGEIYRDAALNYAQKSKYLKEER